MKPSDDELRKAYQARQQGASRASEPAPEELQRLVAREGPDAERLETLDRALSSGKATRDLELLRAISEAAGSAEPRRWWRSAVPLALAASVLLAVGVLSRRGRSPDETRATPADGSIVLVAPATGARVTDSVDFVWRTMPGARSYRVELLSDAGTLVASFETADTIARYAPIAAGSDSTYHWVVVALLAEGVEVASRPRRITLNAP